MVVREGASPGPAPVHSHLVVKLKSGWKFDPLKRVFVPTRGERFSPKGDLPPRSRIVPLLACPPRPPLSKDERELARTLQIILPKGQNAAHSLKRVQKWPCVAEAYVGPDISLPGAGAMTPGS